MKRNHDWHRYDALSSSASTEEAIAWYLRHAANCGCHSIPTAVLAELDARRILLPQNYGLPWSARGTIGMPIAPEVAFGRSLGGREASPNGTSAVKINREWHLAHKTPRNAALEQRLQRHAEHAAARRWSLFSTP